MLPFLVIVTVKDSPSKSYLSTTLKMFKFDWHLIATHNDTPQTQVASLQSIFSVSMCWCVFHTAQCDMWALEVWKWKTQMEVKWKTQMQSYAYLVPSSIYQTYISITRHLLNTEWYYTAKREKKLFLLLLFFQFIYLLSINRHMLQ